MPAATLPLLLNVFVAGMFVASFMMIAYLNPEFRRVRWIALSYAVGMLTPFAETLLPLFTNPVPFKVLSYGSFLVGLALVAPALSIFYCRSPIWWQSAGVIGLGAVTRWLIWNGPRDELWYELTYQAPFALAMASAAWIVSRHGRGQTLDRVLALMFVGVAAHFLLKPFAAAAFGSGATAAAYLDSRYAMISQTGTGLVLIAVGLVLLMNVLQTVISFNRAEARTDALTGLPNRRALFEEFTRRRSEENGTHLVFVLLDIDRFKAINDRLGHDVGDLVLREVALCLSAHKPSDAFVTRVGGEEFALLLPQEPPVALMTTETLRLAVSRLRVPDAPVTISAGVTSVLSDEDLSDTFRRADRGLYKAKIEGRNRSVVETPDRGLQRPSLRLLHG